MAKSARSFLRYSQGITCPRLEEHGANTITSHASSTSINTTAAHLGLSDPATLLDCAGIRGSHWSFLAPGNARYRRCDPARRLPEENFGGGLRKRCLCGNEHMGKRLIEILRRSHCRTTEPAVTNRHASYPTYAGAHTGTTRYQPKSVAQLTISTRPIAASLPVRHIARSTIEVCQQS